MGLLDRFRRTTADAPSVRERPAPAPPTVRASDRTDEEHLRTFVTTRRGVEGFVEPRTAVSDVTLLLVAHDGEWTRRRVPSVQWAHEFANKHQSRRTTPRWSACRSGCVTTTGARRPARSGGQISPAI